MTQHSIDDVYAQVTEIKKKLEATSKEKPKEEPKEEPSQVENWAKSIGFGLDELVKTVKDFKVTSVAAWSTLGAVVTGFIISNFIDKDVAATKALGVIGLERHPDKAIPRPKKGGEVVPGIPVTSIDINRLKALRSSSIALSRSLNDLTRDVRNASREIA
ncbi:hypothetical protein OG288_23015 [Streptomyces tauricus]|uniref:Uncharacterized protein n=1 Tax=Streptomyces tauricus TaxID=68274 RepID=A0ABZ1JHF4_9ACTN|nr:hypothetical protein [Streptomyces tauricus]MCW8100785.1 hypothetical protein [Streptomyces tauricus]